jgi:hypothetical protein
MLTILIGYREPSRNGTPEPLFVGRDRSAALAVLKNPPEGIQRVEMFVNPPVKKRYVVSATDVVPAAPAEPVEVEEKPRRGRPPKVKGDSEESAPVVDSAEDAAEEPAEE